MAEADCWKPIIGLEIHLQLETKAKLFAPEANTFNEPPNTMASEISLAEPGALPQINQKAVTDAIRLGLAFRCEIAGKLEFDRKNYFYPDLPKGYQITQYRSPLGRKGYIELKNDKHISLQSLHLEEDSAKSLHQTDSLAALDFNRAGIPLIEIVTSPTIHDESTAVEVIKEITTLSRYLNISRANMEKGGLRCDINISLKDTGTGKSFSRTEIKNLNSHSQIKQALAYEVDRQKKLLEEGKQPAPESRTFDPKHRRTIPMRAKEVSESYRYFPEVDLLPCPIGKAFLEKLKVLLPETPSDKFKRFRAEYALAAQDAAFLTEEPERAAFFESLARFTSAGQATSWIKGPIQKELKKNNLTLKETKLAPEKIKELVEQIENKNITKEAAENKILPVMMNKKDLDIQRFITTQELKPAGKSQEIDTAIEEMMESFPEETIRLKKGETRLIGFFIGQLTKKLYGQADPRIIRKHLLEALEKENNQ